MEVNGYHSTVVLPTLFKISSFALQKETHTGLKQLEGEEVLTHCNVPFLSELSI